MYQKGGGDMSYYVYNLQISVKSPLRNYCLQQTQYANNMYNATLFRTRQVMTAVKKDPSQWSENEKEIMDEIRNTLPNMNPKYKMPTADDFFLNYSFINELMLYSRNPDYIATGFPRQAAQQVIKEVVRTMKGFYASQREYKKEPGKFNGRPKLPHYLKKGGEHTATFTNQDCVIYKNDDGTSYAKLPKTNLRCELGTLPEGLKLKQVTIKPYHNIFIMSFTFDSASDIVALVSEKPERICAIDIGVENIVTMTNNVGAGPLIVKGGVIKSQNQLYNKKMAKIKSEQTKGTNKKFVSTPESDKLCVKRKNQMTDFMRKTGKLVITTCQEHQIDTIVIGHNDGWKQEANTGKKNNQEFVQIPFDQLIHTITYLAERQGIRVIEREESYTSKASFLDGDPIPTYGDKDIPKFSGKRGSTMYHGHKKTLKKDGSGSPEYRGLYRTKNGTVINSDVNGSANIGRKAFPELFTVANVKLTDPTIIRHPDYENRKILHAIQLASPREPSMAAAKRSARRAQKCK